ncbi:MAG: hypothetical protein LLG04_01685 [Parachlamydia sp.]|nr:hypothetical protein [Parachlamydia sp.]
MNKAVFGLVKDEAQVNRIVGNLLSARFDEDCISILAPKSGDEAISGLCRKHENMPVLGTEKHTKAAECAAAGATAGGVIGGSLGLTIGLGALSIPGLGLFIAAGPILAALSGSAVGGSLGLAIGSLVGWGIPEYEAKQYEAGLKKGHILMSVHGRTGNELQAACDILEKQGATDIAITDEECV